MKFVLNLNDENRILSATYEEFIDAYPEASRTVVDSLPEGNIVNYMYVDGEYVYDPIVPEANELALRLEIMGEINLLKTQLAESDYKAIKYAEGWISETEYSEIKAERQAMRDRINELEAQLVNN